MELGRCAIPVQLQQCLVLAQIEIGSLFVCVVLQLACGYGTTQSWPQIPGWTTAAAAKICADRRSAVVFFLCMQVINDRFLKKIELFSDMSESVLKDIVSDLVPRDYAEGEFLVNEGDDAYEFFAITSGEVSIQVGTTLCLFDSPRKYHMHRLSPVHQVRHDAHKFSARSAGRRSR